MRRAYNILTAILISSTLLTACGGGGSTPATQEATTPQPQTEEAPVSEDDTLKNLYQKLMDATDEEAVNACAEEIRTKIGTKREIPKTVKSAVTEQYKQMYLNMYQAGTPAPLDVLKGGYLRNLKNLSAVSADTEFFKENFNTVMLGYLDGNINDANAIEFCKMLKPLGKDAGTYIDERIDVCADAYDNGSRSFEKVTAWYNVLLKADISYSKTNAKLTGLTDMKNSKQNFIEGKQALENGNYKLAIDKLSTVIYSDAQNYAQKNTLIQEAIQKANAYAINRVEELCRQGQFEDAKKVIEEYDPYVDSKELRDKKNYIAQAQRAYKK